MGEITDAIVTNTDKSSIGALRSDYFLEEDISKLHPLGARACVEGTDIGR